MHLAVARRQKARLCWYLRSLSAAERQEVFQVSGAQLQIHGVTPEVVEQQPAPARRAWPRHLVDLRMILWLEGRGFVFILLEFVLLEVLLIELLWWLMGLFNGRWYTPFTVTRAYCEALAGLLHARISALAAVPATITTTMTTTATTIRARMPPLRMTMTTTATAQSANSWCWGTWCLRLEL